LVLFIGLLLGGLTSIAGFIITLLQCIGSA